jgi:hypothetical protein
MQNFNTAGITRGALQRLQGDLAKRAAMGALLASEAGWWQLELLLSGLAAQAAAGVRPELFALMEVRPGLCRSSRGPRVAFATFLCQQPSASMRRSPVATRAQPRRWKACSRRRPALCTPPA